MFLDEYKNFKSAEQIRHAIEACAWLIKGYEAHFKERSSELSAKIREYRDSGQDIDKLKDDFVVFFNQQKDVNQQVLDNIRKEFKGLLNDQLGALLQFNGYAHPLQTLFKPFLKDASRPDGYFNKISPENLIGFSINPHQIATTTANLEKHKIWFSKDPNEIWSEYVKFQNDFLETIMTMDSVGEAFWGIPERSELPANKNRNSFWAYFMSQFDLDGFEQEPFKRQIKPITDPNETFVLFDSKLYQKSLGRCVSWQEFLDDTAIEELVNDFHSYYRMMAANVDENSLSEAEIKQLTPSYMTAHDLVYYAFFEHYDSLSDALMIRTLRSLLSCEYSALYQAKVFDLNRVIEKLAEANLSVALNDLKWDEKLLKECIEANAFLMRILKRHDAYSVSYADSLLAWDDSVRTLMESVSALPNEYLLNHFDKGEMLTTFTNMARSHVTLSTMFSAWTDSDQSIQPLFKSDEWAQCMMMFGGTIPFIFEEEEGDLKVGVLSALEECIEHHVISLVQKISDGQVIELTNQYFNVLNRAVELYQYIHPHMERFPFTDNIDQNKAITLRCIELYKIICDDERILNLHAELESIMEFDSNLYENISFVDLFEYISKEGIVNFVRNIGEKLKHSRDGFSLTSYSISKPASFAIATGDTPWLLSEMESHLPLVFIEDVMYSYLHAALDNKDGFFKKFKDRDLIAVLEQFQDLGVDFKKPFRMDLVQFLKTPSVRHLNEEEVKSSMNTLDFLKAVAHDWIGGRQMPAWSNIETLMNEFEESFIQIDNADCDISSIQSL